MDKFSNEEKSSFDNAIHLVPVWNMIDKIVYEYLMSFNSPIVKIHPIYSSISSDGENHRISEKLYPM